MEYKDYYEILGVGKDASKDEIHRAYRKLARKFHPDVNKSPDAQAKFIEIKEAYEVLKDPEKRNHYDLYGKSRIDPRWRQPGKESYSTWMGSDKFGRTFHFSRGDFGSHVGDFSDFFKDLFGEGFAGTTHQSPFDFPSSRKGRTHESELSVSLSDVFSGVTKTISFQVWEGGESGTVQSRHRTLQVKIPRGVTNGSMIRLAGQGEKGTGGMPSGDLLFKIKIPPDPMFRVVNHDLYTTIDIAPWEAALGGKIVVKIVNGKVNLTIPSGTRSGRRFRLKGKGIPRQSGDAGDLIVTAQINIPHPLTPEERTLFEKLAEQSRFDPRSKGGQKASGNEKV